MSADENKPSFELTPSTKKPWWKKKKIMIPLVIVIFAIGSTSNSSTDNKSATPTASPSASATESASASATPTEEATQDPGYGSYPEAEAAFIKTIEDGKVELDKASTDLQQSVVLRNRDKALCRILSSNRATNWTGVITNVGANGEGKAYVEIEIAKDITIKTWNNAFSDISDNTLIPTSASFFNNLVSMKDGDLVTFSAKFLQGKNSCLKRANLTEIFYGFSPEFIVKFTDVKKS